MIRDILKTALPQAYHLQRGEVRLETTELTGCVSLKDTKRCGNCKTKQTHPCNEQNMQMDTGIATVTQVDHEAYIRQFHGTQLGRGKNCDYMLADDTGSNYKVAFCDLTCSLEKNVEPDEERRELPEGKRAKVMVQLEDSVRRWMAKEVGRFYLEGFRHRHCIFAWRDPFFSDTPVMPRRGDVAANMKIMGIATSGSEPLLLRRQDIEGLEFVFYQVKYPAVYKW